jgi:hypothetical protein
VLQIIQNYGNFYFKCLKHELELKLSAYGIVFEASRREFICKRSEVMGAETEAQAAARLFMGFLAAGPAPTEPSQVNKRLIPTR